jgi:hypothetical protein
MPWSVKAGNVGVVVRLGQIRQSAKTGIRHSIRSQITPKQLNAVIHRLCSGVRVQVGSN